MTSKTPEPINRAADHLGNGEATTEPSARESYVGKIVFVEPPIGTFGAGEYIVVDQTNNALYGVKLGSAYNGHEVKLIPLIGPVAWMIVRAEPDTSGLIESTILLLSEFAATPPEDRNEGLEDCIYEGADYVAGTLLRMLERRQQQRCGALFRESADASGSDDPKLRGRPRDFAVNVREIQINAGAGFLVVLTGDILRMPGLPRTPLAEQIDLDSRSGEIVGLE